jgi:hypothetical protein
MSGPSDKAVEAATKFIDVMAKGPHANNPIAAKGALEAAHDPALGLDRSVCLRDVVEALRADRVGDAYEMMDASDAADFIEREFGS